MTTPNIRQKWHRHGRLSQTLNSGLSFRRRPRDTEPSTQVQINRANGNILRLQRFQKEEKGQLERRREGERGTQSPVPAPVGALWPVVHVKRRPGAKGSRLWPWVRSTRGEPVLKCPSGQGVGQGQRGTSHPRCEFFFSFFCLFLPFLGRSHGTWRFPG